MAHGDFHLRGDSDPDIEIHAYVDLIRETPHAGVILYIRSHGQDQFTWINEEYIDYMEELQEHAENIFLIPSKLVREWGLLS